METINTMKTFRFYKDQTNRWYADLPDWRGTHAELEMISGADTFLNIMAEGSSEIHVILSDESFENSDLLAIKQYGRSDGWELGEGAWYNMPSYQGIKYPDFEMWLCAVTKFVFGDFPEIIYFSKDANRSSFPEVKEKMKVKHNNVIRSSTTDEVKRKISEGLKKYNNDKVKLKEQDGSGSFGS